VSTLRQSHLRVNRAKEKLALLNRAIERARKAALKTAAEQSDLHARKEPLDKFSGQLWDETRLLISEFALHARVALDYVVFALATRDSGSEQKYTRFPINESPEEFARNRTRCLKHLTDEHVAMIERFQPYKGRHLLAPLLILHRFSNRDKHRELVHISFESVGHQDPEFHARPPTIGITKMEVNIGRSFEVLVHEHGLEVENLPKALADILTQVSEIVDDFDRVLG